MTTLQMPSVSNLAGGIAGLATFAIINMAFPALGIVLSVPAQGLVSMAMNVVVTHVIEKWPDAAKVDAEIKAVAKVLPTATADYTATLPKDGAFASPPVAQGQANSNINQ